MKGTVCGMSQKDQKQLNCVIFGLGSFSESLSVVFRVYGPSGRIVGAFLSAFSYGAGCQE
jgi:hypothetical protein